MVLVVVVAVAAAAIALGWALCAWVNGFRRCPACRQLSELYENQDGRRQCGWCWLRETGQVEHLLGLGWGRR